MQLRSKTPPPTPQKCTDHCSQKDASGCSGEGDQVAFGGLGGTNAVPEAHCSILPNRIPPSSTPPILNNDCALSLSAAPGY